jgi:hypothetical protein
VEGHLIVIIRFTLAATAFVFPTLAPHFIHQAMRPPVNSDEKWPYANIPWLPTGREVRLYQLPQYYLGAKVGHAICQSSTKKTAIFPAYLSSRGNNT